MTAAARGMPWLAGSVAMASAVAVIGHAAGRPSPDVAWNLYVALELLGGSRLGVDLFENTPPMIYLLKSVSVFLAELGGWPVWPVWAMVVLVLSWTSLALSLRQVGRVEWPSASARQLWAAAGLFSLIVLPAGDFGQRDHLTAILILPYVLLTARRAGGSRPSCGAGVTIGLMAAIGIGIKPHFALLPLALWVLVARRGGARAILTSEHITVIVVGMAYLGVVAVCIPGYFAYAAIYGPLYQRFHTEFPALAAFVPTAPSWVLAALTVEAIPTYVGLGLYLGVRGDLRAGQRGVADVLALSTAVLLVAAVVQGKGWRYHFVPTLTFAAALVALLLLCTWERTRRPVARLHLFTGLVTMAALVTVTTSGAVVRAANPRAPHLDADRNLTGLLPLVTSIGPDGYVAVLSTNISSSFPLVLESGARWALRHPNLWPLVAFYDDQVPGKGPVTTRDYSSRTGLELQFTQDVVDDFIRTTPEVLLVLRPDSSTTLWGGARRFNYMDYFARHPLFRDSVLPSYVAAGAIGDYELFVRQERAAPPEE